MVEDDVTEMKFRVDGHVTDHTFSGGRGHPKLLYRNWMWDYVLLYIQGATHENCFIFGQWLYHALFNAQVHDDNEEWICGLFCNFYIQPLAGCWDYVRELCVMAKQASVPEVELPLMGLNRGGVPQREVGLQLMGLSRAPGSLSRCCDPLPGQSTGRSHGNPGSELRRRCLLTPDLGGQ